MAKTLPLTSHTTSEHIAVASKHKVTEASVRAANIKKIDHMVFKSLQYFGLSLVIQGELPEKERRKIEVTYPRLYPKLRIIRDCVTEDP
jgi:hypothetical protein